MVLTRRTRAIRVKASTFHDNDASNNRHALLRTILGRYGLPGGIDLKTSLDRCFQCFLQNGYHSFNILHRVPIDLSSFSGRRQIMRSIWTCRNGPCENIRKCIVNEKTGRLDGLRQYRQFSCRVTTKNGTEDAQDRDFNGYGLMIFRVFQRARRSHNVIDNGVKNRANRIRFIVIV